MLSTEIRTNLPLMQARFDAARDLLRTQPNVDPTRRELLDQIPFWSAGDLERKLLLFREYYNRDRVHASLGGVTPACKAGDVNRRIVSLSEYQWQSHCRRLYQLPVAA